MDIYCGNCLEPWEADCMLHEEPEGFDRDGSLIEFCPCCQGREMKFSPADRERLETIRAIAELSGGDIDSFAAYLEDFGL